ncbi:Transcription factor [Quillaja saponaria]|uniref:Transcription factor n=1 Tax=Quillaja saponaria TaxID=32244 RepID=A0AAD7KZE2_QUISA|nr:Transcription factor [Quillaja saponaria]
MITRTKSIAAEADALSVLSAPWATALERSLHWISGWRPTTAFHLVYSESSILFESHIMDTLRGVRTGDLGDLSPTQFRRVSELQCDTVKEENAMTEELSEWQGRCQRASWWLYGH